MKERQLSLTRGHLFALGVLSLALAALTFFIGVEVGRQQAPDAPSPVQAGLVPDEVRSGDLEVLLAKVDEHRDASLGFPRDLVSPALGPSSDGVPTSGFAIQVSEGDDIARAQRLVETLRAAKLPAYRVAAIVDGQALQRVRIGGYSSEESANAARSEVASRAGSGDASVVAAP